MHFSNLLQLLTVGFFFYCTYMLLEVGVAADVSFTKAEGNDLSWLFLTFLRVIFPIYAINAA